MVSAGHKSKHVPLRRCVACRRSREQGALERFYRDSEGRWQHDPLRKAGGRGAWVCADNPACHHKKALGRFFRVQAQDVANLLQRKEPLQKEAQLNRNGGLHG